MHSDRGNLNTLLPSYFATDIILSREKFLHNQAVFEIVKATERHAKFRWAQIARREK